jgi:hypothetical protein
VKFSLPFRCFPSPALLDLCPLSLLPCTLSITWVFFSATSSPMTSSILFSILSNHNNIINSISYYSFRWFFDFVLECCQCSLLNPHYGLCWWAGLPVLDWCQSSLSEDVVVRPVSEVDTSKPVCMVCAICSRFMPE